MPDSKPRCVYPRTSGAACGKTEPQHGPVTGHAFTLHHVPEPHNPDAEQTSGLGTVPPPEPAGQDAQVYRPDTFARMMYDPPLDAGTFKGEPQRLEGQMVEGDPLEGTLLSSVPDPTVTLRTEMPDGTLVEVTVAHPHHDTVKMARTALVAAEYVMGAIARAHAPEPGDTP